MAVDAKGLINRIFLYWSAGHYGQPFGDYHVNIDSNGELYTDVYGLTELLPHTWHENTGSVAVSLLYCALQQRKILACCYLDFI